MLPFLVILISGIIGVYAYIYWPLIYCRLFWLWTMCKNVIRLTTKRKCTNRTFLLKLMFKELFFLGDPHR